MSNNKKVTELTQVAAMAKSDLFYVVQSGTNDRKATFEDLSATEAETQAGTSEVKFVTPAGLAELNLSDYSTMDWYVDSVNGSDANDGDEINAPLKTIAALMLKSIAAGDKIGLKSGSHWREQFTITESNLTIQAYGAGDRPLLDASDILVAGSFSKTGGRTYVYEISATIAYHASMTYVRVWENDLAMTRASSVANCDATPGTYYPSSDTSSPITIYIHPFNNTDPTSDGHVYEYNARSYGFYSYAASSPSVYNIRTRRNLNDSGAFVLGASGYAENCTAEDGTKHNFFMRTGSVIKNCDAINAYYGTTSSSLFVYNENSPAGENIKLIGCRGINERYNNYSTGILGHSNIGGTFGDVTLEDCEFKNNVVGCDLGLGSGYTGSETITVRRCKFYENVIDMYASVPCTYMITGCIDENIRICNQFLVDQSTAAGAMIYLYGNQHKYTKCTANQGIITILYAVTVDISYCDFRVESTVANIVIYVNKAGAVVDVDHCTFDFPSNAEQYVYYRDAGTLTSDYNQFFQDTCNFYIGGGYATLALYQAGTGLDAHSTSG